MGGGEFWRDREPSSSDRITAYSFCPYKDEPAEDLQVVDVKIKISQILHVPPMCVDIRDDDGEPFDDEINDTHFLMDLISWGHHSRRTTWFKMTMVPEVNYSCSESHSESHRSYSH